MGLLGTVNLQEKNCKMKPLSKVMIASLVAPVSK